MDKKDMTEGLYFVREKGKDQIYTADYNGGLLYRYNDQKETAELEVIERVPPETVVACVKGTKILNLARTMGLLKARGR